MNGLKQLTCVVLSSLVLAPAAYAKHDDGRYDGAGRGKAFKGGDHIPPGQAKKMWRRGEKLPRNYVVETRYVVVEPQRYRLPAPPPGYRWVGVDGDAYMVQTQTGLISQVIASLLR